MESSGAGARVAPEHGIWHATEDMFRAFGAEQTTAYAEVRNGCEMKRRRDLGTDALWGVRQGLGLGAIVLLPAGIAVLAQPSGHGRTAVFIAAYLVFSLLAGLCVGLCRPWLKRRGVPFILGAVIGIAGFAALIVPACSRRGIPLSRSLTASAVLGCVVGGFFGLWMLKRQRGAP